MVKDIAGGDSLYFYSQLPFVEFLTFPAFFEPLKTFLHHKRVLCNELNYYFL